MVLFMLITGGNSVKVHSFYKERLEINADLIEESTETILSKATGIRSEVECGVKCLASTKCKSLFYRQSDGVCQTHSDVIDQIKSSQQAPGMAYSAIIQRKIGKFHLVCKTYARSVIINGRGVIYVYFCHLMDIH